MHQKARNTGLSAILTALALLAPCSVGTQIADAQAKSTSATFPDYPVKVSANRRYLVDQKNIPFLIAGDSPQGLIFRLDEAQVESYFADRQANGFNTAGWVDVLCAGRDYPSNIYGATVDGIRPFTAFVRGGSDWTHYDLRKPNEAYFTRLDHIVEMAAKHRILVFLDPIETAGWLATLRSNGLAADYSYGQYLGHRYKKFANIAWINGNDFSGWRNSGDDALVRAVAKGILSADPGHIQTVEFNPPTGSSLDDPTWSSIISINGAYVYGPTYIQMLHNYNQKPIMPTFLVEAHYDLEDVGGPSDFGTPSVLRREEYWAMLSGGKGQFYGNRYTWSFADGWQKHLDTPGVAQFKIWREFFDSIPWQALAPDQAHTVVTAGFGTFGDIRATHVSKSDYCTASKTPDGTVVVAYMPTIRTITVNMASLKAPATAKWFDPTNGVYAPIPGGPLANKGTRKFTPPGNNHDGDGDWLLLLTANDK
ncbi:MAG: apiosidase-like domain-containing protein [Acidobacteriaceae bacterium]